MEEILWVMKQRSRELQDYRKDIRPTWDDEAAKELNLRYLDPQEKDSYKMLNSLQQQQQRLEETAAELVQANEHASCASQRSQQVQHFLALKRQDVQRSYQYYDLYRENYAATQAEFPIIASFINQANRLC